MALTLLKRATSRSLHFQTFELTSSNLLVASTLRPSTAPRFRPNRTSLHSTPLMGIPVPPPTRQPPTPTPAPRNVLGGELQCCCLAPRTGFYRDGFCRTGPQDIGRHVVCAHVTQEFLDFTRARGNDLSTPRLEYGFPGLRPGDRWCLCVERWKEAMEEGVAPPVVLESTHVSALEYVTVAELRAHAVAQ